jgi:hypothetical protein
MAVRDFVLNNYRWKLTALVLAMLVWFVIKLAIYRGTTGGPETVLRNRRVLVLKAPDDPRSYRVDPSEVNVFVQGSKELGSEDPQVFVNLTSWPEELNSGFKQVLVRAVDATKVRVQPLFVMVERTSPPESSLRNSLKKP